MASIANPDIMQLGGLSNYLGEEAVQPGFNKESRTPEENTAEPFEKTTLILTFFGGLVVGFGLGFLIIKTGNR